jgi:serine phosphatase RsbU (regulator of sigma subunit)
MTDRIGALDDVDFFVKQSLMEYSMLLSMTDGEYEEYDKLERELRKLLRSAVVPKQKTKKKA